MTETVKEIQIPEYREALSRDLKGVVIQLCQKYPLRSVAILVDDVALAHCNKASSMWGQECGEIPPDDVEIALGMLQAATVFQRELALHYLTAADTEIAQRQIRLEELRRATLAELRRCDELSDEKDRFSLEVAALKKRKTSGSNSEAKDSRQPGENPDPVGPP